MSYNCPNPRGSGGRGGTRGGRGSSRGGYGGGHGYRGGGRVEAVVAQGPMWRLVRILSPSL